MSNFNKIFVIIKNKCKQQKKLAEISCFDVISKEATIADDRLPMYLNHLQDIGVIKYSIADKYIYLTREGARLESLVDLETSVK